MDEIYGVVDHPEKTQGEVASVLVGSLRQDVSEVVDGDEEAHALQLSTALLDVFDESSASGCSGFGLGIDDLEVILDFALIQLCGTRHCFEL